VKEHTKKIKNVKNKRELELSGTQAIKKYGISDFSKKASPKY
jgi:hypothetical protein